MFSSVNRAHEEHREPHSGGQQNKVYLYPWVEDKDDNNNFATRHDMSSTAAAASSSPQNVDQYNSRRKMRNDSAQFHSSIFPSVPKASDSHNNALQQNIAAKNGKRRAIKFFLLSFLIYTVS